MPASFRPTWSSLENLGQGTKGIERTLQVMAEIVRRDCADQELRDFALNLVRNVRGHGFMDEIESVFAYCRDAITYRKDPVLVERVQDARRTIHFKTGDCDDKSLLLCVLLGTLGHRTRFKLAGNSPTQWTHVYVEVLAPDAKWIALDPTAEQAHPGWETNGHKGIFEIFSAAIPKSKRRKKRTINLGDVIVDYDEFHSYLSGAAPCPCGCYINENLGEEKKCGFFCKVGKGFKAVGKAVVKVAPLALSLIPIPGAGAAGQAISGAAKAMKAVRTGLTVASGLNRGGGQQQQSNPAADQQSQQAEAQPMPQAAPESSSFGGIDPKYLMYGGIALVAFMVLKN